MKKENLQRGNEIQKQIENLDNELSKWESATKFNYIRLTTKYGNQEVDCIYDFNVIKTLTVQSIKDELQKLNIEFEKL